MPARCAERHLIRMATPGDAPAVSRLMQRAFGHGLAQAYPPEIASAVLPEMARANPSLLRSQTYFLVDRGGSIVGAGGWTRRDPQGGETPPDEGHIRHLACDPDASGQGVGSALVARICAQARRAGLRRLHCSSSFGAASFYERRGFVRMGQETPVINGVAFPCVLLCREL